MNLQQFLNFFEIKPDSLEAIKKRVFIVGRFNTSEAETSAYLFSKNRRKDQRYRDCRDLSYASFIDVIKPTLTESYETGEEIATGQHLPYFELSPQTADRSKGDASYVIDPYNYFFQRAVSTSEHEHYKQNTENLSSKLPENTAGETIYKEIRQNLKKFCSFQSRNYELIRAFSQLLHANRGKGGIPGAFADGEVLPVKFLPVFIDFLYQEGTDPFVVDSVDFESQQIWRPTMTGPRKDTFLLNFSKLVSVFKNYLIDPKGLARERIDNIDLRSLTTIVDSDLQTAFVASRDSYNMLRQIIRSKVLLSMVLQWATSSFRELDSVKHEVTEAKKNTAIEKAIKEGADGLAEPLRNLANGRSVSEMIADFKDSFPKIIEYVTTPEDPSTKDAFLTLSDFLQNIGNRILKDEPKADNIRLVMTMHPDQKRAALQALESYFVDVLIPRMFKEPGLTLDELKRKFNTYEATLLQQSSLMDVANTDKLTGLEAKEKETYEETFTRVMNTMVEVLVDDNVVASIIRTAQTAENQVIQRALLPASDRIGQMVPLLSPVENASTSAFGQSIEEPVGDEIIAVMELQQPETISRLKETFPALSAAPGPGTNNLLAPGDPGQAADEQAEDAQLVASIKEKELFLGLRNNTLGRMEQNKNRNLGMALQAYAHADEDNRAMALQEVREIIHEDVKVYHYNLSRIYKKYVAPTALTNFKNKVEAMTLSQLLLVHQNELHLDKAGTNLFDLLLDLIEFIDTPEQPNLKKFFSEHSLTKYVAEKHFNHNGRGFAALESGLKNQAEKSLNNVKQYVSELQGVKYLLDVLEKNQADCEVVVINAHWHEFLNWVTDNIDDVEKNILNPAGLTTHNASNPQFPVMAYMTELSFNNEGYDNTISQKADFLNELGSVFSQSGDGSESKNVVLMPPICISTSVAGSDKKWIDDGISLNELCRNVSSPVLVLGPSVSLNSKSDKGFETTLASGYLLCTHLLNAGKKQHIELKSVNASSLERFRVIGYGAFGISNSIKNLVEAPDPTYDYSFAADFYLYIIGLLAAAAWYSGRAPDHKQLDISGLDFWQAFYNCFNCNAKHQPKHAESKVLDRIALHRKITDWSLENDISNGADLLSVQMFLNERKDKFQTFKNIAWFNNLVSSLKLNKQQAPVNN